MTSGVCAPSAFLLVPDYLEDTSPEGLTERLTPSSSA